MKGLQIEAGASSLLPTHSIFNLVFGDFVFKVRILDICIVANYIKNNGTT
jgi:hypothetical protein